MNVATIAADVAPFGGRNALKLLSFNIQTGVDTQDFHEYVTKSWKHLLPLKERISNLNRIADLVQSYDIVGLQEVDSGSLRTGFLDQTEYLAHRARLRYRRRPPHGSAHQLAGAARGAALGFGTLALGS